MSARNRWRRIFFTDISKSLPQSAAQEGPLRRSVQEQSMAKRVGGDILGGIQRR
jgi:hypothetical protein